MSLTHLEGYHLTARDRQAITYALEQGWTSADTGRKWYEIQPAERRKPGVYRVRLGFKSEPHFSRHLVRWNDYEPPAQSETTQAELFA